MCYRAADMTENAKKSTDALPSGIFCAADYVAQARARMDPGLFAHIAGGAGQEVTLRGNEAAYARLHVYNRILESGDNGTTRAEVLGQSFAHPVFLAPVAHQKLLSPEGEVATARAAHALGSCMVASTLSSCAIEDIAAAGGGPLWFQLYFQHDRDLTLRLVRRAEAAGCSALVVTVDAPVQTQTLSAARLGYSLPADAVAGNVFDQPLPRQRVLRPEQSIVFQGFMADAPRWSDVGWLVREARVPVLLKGVTHPDDAARAVAEGAAGIVVSNHGGRALDGAPPTLLALPAIRARLGPQACVLVDGGVRSGGDVFKALASGANAVLVGRLQAYALAVAGAAGVAHLIKLLRDELEVAMALAGTLTVDRISAASLFRETAG